MDLQGEMRARVSWALVLAVFLAFPPFQRERVEEMGFGEILRMGRMRVDLALTQALRSRWDTEATAFVFPWGHMIPSLEDVSRITGLRIYGRPRRSSLVPRVALQESLGLYDAGKNAGESEDEYLERLARVSRRELVSEPGPQADLDLRRFLVLFLGRLLFATRGDAVHCRFLPLLENLGEVGGYAWGVAFLAHQYDSLSASERQTSTGGFYPFLQVWAYLHLPALGRGDLVRPGLVPIARRWDSRRDTRHLVDQLERLQEAIDSHPYLDVIWQPYLGEGYEGQPWLVQARPYFGRSVWLHALNLVLPLNLFLTQRSLGLRQSAVEFPVRDRFTVGFFIYHDRETAQRQVAELRSELEKVRSTGAGGASSSRDAGGSPSLLEARLAGAVLRAEEVQRHLEERERDLRLTTKHAMDLQAQRDQYQGQRDHLQGEIQSTRSERDQLHIRAEAAETRSAEATGERDQLRVRAEAAETRVAEMTRELATLRVERLCVVLQAQEAVARSLQQIVTGIGRSRSRSRSVASGSRVTGGTVGQYLASSSSRRRNEEEGRRRQDEAGTHQGEGGGGEMRHHLTDKRDPRSVAVGSEET
ncbi:hypothetical protein Taro_054599, partial [Colocasia esculenta]|nr:hypothetical protein [Colocasia esculenta]